MRKKQKEMEINKFIRVLVSNVPIALLERLLVSETIFVTNIICVLSQPHFTGMTDNVIIPNNLPLFESASLVQ